MSHVLIVDDEESICWGLKRLLQESGHSVSVASSAEEGLSQARRKRPDLAVLDVRLPGMDGLSAMRPLRECAGNLPIVVITAFGSLDVAVSAMRGGAFDYLTKPFDLEQAASVIDRALAHRPVSQNEDAGAADTMQAELLGASPAMQEVYKRIALVAPADASVLITGESGTGKELVARAIHRHSRRAAAPFVPIHLASLSPTLVESELFGHERGSFTGAEAARTGLLELAHGATVFFDEAGDIPPNVQVKLLRVLEQHEVTPVGSAQPRATSFRVIAATSRPLDADPEALRRDLYFRLAAFEIHLPPLRERVQDIPLLSEAFLRRATSQTTTAKEFSAAAMEELCRRPWPGNVRQLRHAVEHGLLLARGRQIETEHLPPPEPLPTPATTSDELQVAVRNWTVRQLASRAAEGSIYQEFLARAEPSLFDVVLEQTTGNRAAAADLLGIHRATLRKKLASSDE
jgi:two-component system nitrogen regulation response regulator GlnG